MHDKVVLDRLCGMVGMHDMKEPLICFLLQASSAVIAATACVDYKGFIRGRSDAGTTTTDRSGNNVQSNGSMALSSSSSVSARPPAVSVIIPVLNEAKGIGDTLQYIRSMDPRPLDIVVVDGGSSDGTVLAAIREGVRVVRSGRGRAKQMNRGAEAAQG